LYINLSSANFFQTLTDSLFESVSGFTTTGFSVIPDLSVLPQSIILYRALTQFIGGIGVVLVLLAFFYPEARLKEFARSMGLSKDNHRIKKTFLFIVGLNCAFTAVMIGLGYAFGYHDLINLASAVFSAVSTGGFSPVNDLTTLLTTTPLNIILPICMVFGASNILIFAGLYRKKFREFLNSETTVLLIIIGVASAILAVFYGFTSYDAGFHVISAMSTTGFSYLPIGGWVDSLKLFVVSLMFIGGASFSTAGGIKIYRLMLLIKSVPTTVNFAVTGKEIKVRLFEKDYGMGEIIQAAIMVFLTSALIIVSSLVVSYYGFNLVDALFDCTAAVATTGLSVGVVTPTLALELKWLFMVLMIVGRVEIIVFLVMFSRAKEKHGTNGCNGKKHASRKKPKADLEEFGGKISSSIKKMGTSTKRKSKSSSEGEDSASKSSEMPEEHSGAQEETALADA
jgi:trk system potassium uptake protein TrkH